MATNVKLVRFLAGPECMGEVVAETDTTITLKNAVRIIVMPTQMDNKSPQVALAPFSDWSDDKEVTLNKSFVLALMNPVTDFINQYNSTFGGIKIPDSKIILPGQKD